MLQRHLGSAVSALVDGQLGAAAAEDAWRHVHLCPRCRTRVQEEVLVKQRLAGFARSAARPVPWDEPVGPRGGVLPRGRRRAVAAVGAGVVSAAVVGVGGFALGLGGSDPAVRRPPTPSTAAESRPSATPGVPSTSPGRVPDPTGLGVAARLTAPEVP